MFWPTVITIRAALLVSLKRRRPRSASTRPPGDSAAPLQVQLASFGPNLAPPATSVCWCGSTGVLVVVAATDSKSTIQGQLRGAPRAVCVCLPAHLTALMFDTLGCRLFCLFARRQKVHKSPAMLSLLDGRQEDANNAGDDDDEAAERSARGAARILAAPVTR